MFEYTNSSHHSTYILVNSKLTEAGGIILWNLFRSAQTRSERVESSGSKSYQIRSGLTMPTWFPSNLINSNPLIRSGCIGCFKRRSQFDEQKKHSPRPPRRRGPFHIGRGGRGRRLQRNLRHMAATEKHCCSGSDSGCKLLIFHVFFFLPFFQHICGG